MPEKGRSPELHRSLRCRRQGSDPVAGIARRGAEVNPAGDPTAAARDCANSSTNGGQLTESHETRVTGAARDFAAVKAGMRAQGKAEMADRMGRLPD